MKFQLEFDFPPIERKVEHPSRIFLIGSCFAENITNYLQELKYNVLSNPHGILYNPKSISNAIKRIITRQVYTQADLFERDGLFHCFDFHSSFSGVDKVAVLKDMNQSLNNAYDFLKKSEYFIITLGTSYVYKHIERAIYVGNNHKMPSTEFRKQLLSAEQNVACLKEMVEAVKGLNPKVQFIFTVSPVRHTKDGVVENNISKANLISAVHKFESEAYYFPAYELVTDVLRDYRFYKKDLVHPNEQAVQYVWEAFVNKCLSEKDEDLRYKLLQLNRNMNHKPLHKDSQSYKSFVASIHQQAKALQKLYPHLNLDV